LRNPAHKYTLIVETVAVFFAIAVALFAQSHANHMHSSASGVTAPPGVIDGSLHPELIPDEAAITVFWISIMEPPNSDPLARDRFDAKIHKMDLPATDAEILWAAAQQFQSAFEPYRDQARQLAEASVAKAVPAATLKALAQQRADVAASIDRLASTNHAGILGRLSPKGAVAFRENLMDVKLHMKIVPPPKM
jgi:hypothetical protein